MGFGDDGQASDGLGPMVGRPRGAEWRALQADGIVWEGQVLLVGDEVDLAARMVVTQRRVAFVRGGSIALEVARSWLRPAPRLLSDGTLLLSISAPGASIFTEPETIPLWMRDGQQAVGQLIAMLAGSGARPLPRDTVALARPNSLSPLPPLPPLPEPGSHDRASGARPSGSRRGSYPAPRWPLDRDLDDDIGYNSPSFDPPAARRQRTNWPPDGPPLAVPARTFGPAEGAEPAEPSEPESVLIAPSESLVRRPAPPVAVGSDRDWNLEPIKGLLPRGSRKRRRWTLRIGGLFLLVLIAAGVGVLSADRPFPAVQDEAVLTPSATEIPPPSTEVAQAASESGERTAPAEQTALAVGVGGAEASTAEVAPTAAGRSTGGVASGGGAAEETATGAPPTSTDEPSPTARATVAPAPAGDGETSVPPTRSSGAESPGDAQAVAPSATAPTQPTTTIAQQATATSTPEPTPPATATAAATATAKPAPSPMPSPPVAPDPTEATRQGPSETFVRGPLRFSVERAERGATLPAFSLAGSGSSEWVAVIVSVRNWAGVPGEVEMDAFELTTVDGQPVAQLDPISDTVGSFAGLGPGFGPGDVVPMPTGGSERLALAFLVPPDVGELVLRFGEDELALGDE